LLPVEGEPLSREGAAQDGDTLHGPGNARLEGHPDAFEFLAVIAHTNAQTEAPTRQRVDDQRIFGEAHWMVERNLRDVGTDGYAFCPDGDRGTHE